LAIPEWAGHQVSTGVAKKMFDQIYKSIFEPLIDELTGKARCLGQQLRSS